MQRVRINTTYTGPVIPGDHDWHLASITGDAAKIQTLSLGKGVFSMWLPWSYLEAVAPDVMLPGSNIKALQELTDWCNAYDVPISATAALILDCPTIWELIQ